MSTTVPAPNGAPPASPTASAAAAGDDAARRYDAAALREYASDLLLRIGVREDIAGDVAAVLVDGDLMGHTTHGLALLPGYLQALCDTDMRRDGEPTTLASSPAAETWDGNRLPGPWLTLRALESSATDQSLIKAGAGEATLTIKPGYKFRVADALLTNFHLPQSSLLILVSTFAGRELVLRAYRHAVAERYRFYSYGDCMLIL